jgi:hypothetical protein
MAMDLQYRKTEHGIELGFGRITHPCCITAMADGVVAAKAIESIIETGAEYAPSEMKLDSIA